MENDIKPNFYEQIFQAGQAAAIQGKPMDSCPYHGDGSRQERLRDFWIDGWFKGKHLIKEN